MPTTPMPIQETCFHCMPARWLACVADQISSTPNAADGEDDGQQPPIVIANSGALFHASLALRFSRSALAARSSADCCGGGWLAAWRRGLRPCAVSGLRAAGADGLLPPEAHRRCAAESAAGQLPLLLVVVRLDDVARDRRGGHRRRSRRLAPARRRRSPDCGAARSPRTRRCFWSAFVFRRAPCLRAPITCAVPVLPQNSMPGSLDAAAVPPSFTTPHIACVTKSVVDSEIGKSISGAG